MLPSTFWPLPSTESTELKKPLNIAAYKAELHFFMHSGAKPPRGDLAAGETVMATVA